MSGWKLCPYAQGSGYGLGLAPTTKQASLERAWAEAHNALPFADGMSASIVSDCMVGAAIIGLFQSVRPSAIAGFVVAIYIYAIQRMSVWARPHVVEEIDEQSPPLAYPDASPAVISVFRIFSVSASRLSAIPRTIFWRPTSPMSVVASGGGISAQASATLSHTKPEGCSDHHVTGSAITSAIPHRFASVLPLVVGSRDDYETAESVARHILKSVGSHGLIVGQKTMMWHQKEQELA